VILSEGDQEQGGAPQTAVLSGVSSAAGKPPLPKKDLQMDKVYVPNRKSGSIKPRTVKYLELDKKKSKRKSKVQT